MRFVLCAEDGLIYDLNAPGCLSRVLMVLAFVDPAAERPPVAQRAGGRAVAGPEARFGPSLTPLRPPLLSHRSPLTPWGQQRLPVQLTLGEGASQTGNQKPLRPPHAHPGACSEPPGPPRDFKGAPVNPHKERSKQHQLLPGGLRRKKNASDDSLKPLSVRPTPCTHA